uniref:Uncharacterized protein n=1 Tax=Triticum urartu TaxID=4572 RepID=A0A8R7PPH1_TRIUA
MHALFHIMDPTVQINLHPLGEYSDNNIWEVFSMFRCSLLVISQITNLPTDTLQTLYWQQWLCALLEYRGPMIF